MIKLDFKNWFFTEGYEVFGFDPPIPSPKEIRKERDEIPLKSFDIHKLTEYLARFSIEDKQPSDSFANEIVWGEGYGALRVKSGTGYSVFIDRLCYDLEGEPTWITKELYQINRDGYGGHEETVANDILDRLRSINKLPVDSPKPEFNLEDAVFEIASKVKRNLNKVFYFDRIKKINENNYLVNLGLKAAGVETQDHRRVLENHTSITFDKVRGTIKIINTNIESDVGKAPKWEIQPADTDFMFMPTQSFDEMAEVMAVAMKYY